MSHFLSIVDNDPKLSSEVKTMVNEFNRMSDGDKLAIASGIVESQKNNLWLWMLCLIC